MALKKLNLVLKDAWLKQVQIRFYAKKYEYDIPETYNNSFYLANSTLVDRTNWFVHNALGVIYQELIEKLLCEGCNNYSEAKRQFSSILNILEPCNNFIDIKFPVKMDNGEFELYRGFRAEHGRYINTRPCLGGLRLCENIETSDIKALASLSTYKYACMGIDLLGAYGGISVSSKHLTVQEMERIVKTYTTELTKKGFCGEFTNIFEPDMNCGSDEMKWVVATSSKVRGVIGNACAVGKPVSFGGIKNREEAVAQGICFGLDIFLQNRIIMESIGLDVGWSNKTFIVQGLGNVGGSTALHFEQAGMKCIGIAEHDCHIYIPQGINIQDAIAYKRKNGTLEGFNNYTKCDMQNVVLTSDCDVLLLAASERSLTYYIADDIKAKIVIEAANGPISPSVHKILVGHNKLVLPDIFINAGSSVASYFEYLNNLQHLPATIVKDYYSSDKLDNLLNLHKLSSDSDPGSKELQQKILLSSSEKNIVTGIIINIMQQTAKDIIKTAKLYRLNLDFRTAAYINALKKLFWVAYINLKTSTSPKNSRK